jgi:pimeloyl-ACP methyl ester carboxylesterase
MKAKLALATACWLLGVAWSSTLHAQSAQYDPVTSDPPTTDAQFPPALRGFSVTSGGVPLNGRALLAEGKGPHPTVLLLHGQPGIELNLDLAQAMRRAGWNVFTFHYRGSWGSGGEYSINNLLEDTRNVLAHVRGLNPAEWRVDADRVVLVGHSMGGFAALSTGARDPKVRSIASLAGFDMGGAGQVAASDANAREFWVRVFKQSTALRVPEPEAMVNQWIANAPEFAFAKLPPLIGQKSVLLVAGSRDTVSEPRRHHVPLATALKASPGFVEVMLDSDHSFSDRRIALTRAVLGWLEKQK